MSQVVGTYGERTSADAARGLLLEAGHLAGRITLLAPRPAGGGRPPLHLKRRSELLVRKAVRWGMIGALVTEIPLIIVLLLVPIDVNAKVLLASTVWKFGGAFGAWLGAIAASDKGLDAEDALRYEKLLNGGTWLLSADVRPRYRPYARGAMLESDAMDVSDVRGTFEVAPDRPGDIRRFAGN